MAPLTIHRLAPMSVSLYHADCRDVLRRLPDNSIDSVVTDPPYALVSIVKRFGGKNAAPAQEGADGAFARAARGFMGKTWDTGETAFAAEFWAEVLRVLKPGGHVLAFSGTRTQHRLVCAIEDAGFEIRDQIGWLYGSGFPKSHDVAIQMEKRLCVYDPIAKTWSYIDDGTPMREDAPFRDDDANDWVGHGTALKPAWEPICVARKPLIGTVMQNVLEHGTGSINIDGCRVENDQYDPARVQRQQSNRVTWEGGDASGFASDHVQATYDPRGRFPANIIHDGSLEVLAAFPITKGAKGKSRGDRSSKTATIYGAMADGPVMLPRNDEGSAARFFYSAKAGKLDRAGSKHPTVKPVDLMAYLCRLVTPPGGIVLDPFAGSGTTLVAAQQEGFKAIGCEREDEYVADIARRFGYEIPGSEAA